MQANLDSVKIDILEHTRVLEWLWWDSRWSRFRSGTLVLDWYWSERGRRVDCDGTGVHSLWVRFVFMLWF